MPVRQVGDQGAVDDGLLRQEAERQQRPASSWRWCVGQDLARVFVPNGAQILIKGLDRITVNKEAAETVMKEIAGPLQKECDAVEKQVKAVEG